MPSSFSGGISASAAFSEIPASGYQAGVATKIAPCRFLSSFVPGTLADQIDGLAPIAHTYVSSTPQTIDLSALVDVFGVALTVARVRFFAVKNVDLVDGHVLKLGANGSNDWLGLSSTGSTVNVYPTSPGSINDGWTIFSAPGLTAMPVDSTHKILKCDPGAAAFRALYLIGTSST